mmetsp:Transcript_107414/g.331865  ORF Transcript_107414/g.331865 Transcript_107414/m.331865 type:complete len:516 (+) Transcript_107414:1623-3170(+)
MIQLLPADDVADDHVAVAVEVLLPALGSFQGKALAVNGPDLERVLLWLGLKQLRHAQQSLALAGNLDQPFIHEGNLGSFLAHLLDAFGRVRIAVLGNDLGLDLKSQLGNAGSRPVSAVAQAEGLLDLPKLVLEGPSGESILQLLEHLDRLQYGHPRRAPKEGPLELCLRALAGIRIVRGAGVQRDRALHCDGAALREHLRGRHRAERAAVVATAALLRAQEPYARREAQLLHQQTPQGAGRGLPAHDDLPRVARVRSAQDDAALLLLRHPGQREAHGGRRTFDVRQGGKRTSPRARVDEGHQAGEAREQLLDAVAHVLPEGRQLRLLVEGLVEAPHARQHACPGPPQHVEHRLQRLLAARLEGRPLHTHQEEGDGVELALADPQCQEVRVADEVAPHGLHPGEHGLQRLPERHRLRLVDDHHLDVGARAHRGVPVVQRARGRGIADAAEGNLGWDPRRGLRRGLQRLRGLRAAALILLGRPALPERSRGPDRVLAHAVPRRPENVPQCLEVLCFQ